MRLALVGTGQMGQAVERVALDRGHEIIARFDVDHPLTEIEDLKDAGLHSVDAFVDFTLPEVAKVHLERYCRWDATAVVGTTGWYDALPEVRRWAADSNAAILYAPNFSLGIALLVRALRSIAPLLNDLPEFDPYIHEIHHIRKVDSPSGTAMLLAGVLVDALSRKDHIETETQHQRINPSALHVTSTRAGNVFGKHVVAIDSPFDEIEIIHNAKNRQGLAFGAVRAAEWLRGRRGFYSFDDMLAEGLS